MDDQRYSQIYTVKNRLHEKTCCSKGPFQKRKLEIKVKKLQKSNT